VEWFVGPDRAGGGEPDARPPDDDTVPACRGLAYGMTRLVELSDYAAHILSALGHQDVAVEQFHPEYAPGQFEVSVAAAEPVSAADDAVLVRQTIQAVSRRHGLRASFAPVVLAGQVGNGGHLHLSAWDGPRNLFAGGSGPYGLTGRGESMLAGLLDALPALSAVGSPSVASYLRLLPSRWAGAYACWGRENREAALRFITGTIGSESSEANAELKSFDLSANPYLVVGAVIAVGLAGVDARRQLPPEVTGDPARKPAAELDSLGVRRLPQSLPEAISHLARAPMSCAQTWGMPSSNPSSRCGVPRSVCSPIALLKRSPPRRAGGSGLEASGAEVYVHLLIFNLIAHSDSDQAAVPSRQ